MPDIVICLMEHRKYIQRFFILLIALGICACEQESEGISPASSADMIFSNGAIYTVNKAQPWAQALAIADGKIAFAGSNEEVKSFIGANTKLIDLDGRMLMPSFQDSHIHPISGGMEANAIDLNGQTSIDEYINTLKTYAAAHPEEAWLIGGGWLASAFGPGALANRKLIDAVVPSRPVYLTSADGHSAWVNSRALELAGIDNETPDPPGGRIDRDIKSGEAIGSLQETAVDLVFKHIPAPSIQTRMVGLRYSIKMLNAYGITAIQDANVKRADFETYQALDQKGELSLRVIASIWWEPDQGLNQIESIKDLRKEFTAGNVTATTVKIMQDGVMENFTAAMLEPYIGQGSNKGSSMLEPESLNRAVAALDAEGFQLHFHAIGDAAIRQCLDAVELARQQNGGLDHRHHISHLELIHEDDIARFAALDVIANFQPLWAYADEYITDLTLPFIGEERGRWLYPIASVQKHGGRIAFGSDWSVSSANPLLQIETAITRKNALSEDETVFIAEERIDLESAIAAFTINAAFVNKLDKTTGSIEPGKAADLIVLDRNLFEIPSEELSEAKVLLTLLNGKPVYDDLTK